jgi:pimeloyl-ACP methyl ester carboxylesterase
MRDLLTVLGVDRVTVVGHSFGGGIAMQFAYQFPERTERMILLAPGGLGPDVSPFIKMIQAPGWELAMSVLTKPGIRHVGTTAMRTLAHSGIARTRDLDETADILESWKDPRTRFAIRHLVRTVVDWKGQIVTMTDRAYLTETMPMLVVWGRDDQVIPVRHINTAASLASQAVTEVFPNSGHFPHKDHPDRFVKVLNKFMRSTAPSTYSKPRIRSLLKRGSLITVQQAEGGKAPVAPLRALSGA